MLFLQLPKELRNTIYIFALCPGIQGRPPSTRRGASSNNQTLALLAACRQIHAEALPLYYSRNTFCVDHTDGLRDLVKSHNATHIRAISLTPDAVTISHYRMFESALRRLSRLEYLELRTPANTLQCRDYRIPESWSLEQHLESSRDTEWLMSLSGLYHFSIVWITRCPQEGHGDHDACTVCGGWAKAREQVEASLRKEVMQPRAPWGESPTHLARMAARNRLWRRERFRGEIRRFEERMRLELEFPGRRVVCEEVRSRFAMSREDAGC